MRALIAPRNQMNNCHKRRQTFEILLFHLLISLNSNRMDCTSTINFVLFKIRGRKFKKTTIRLTIANCVLYVMTISVGFVCGSSTSSCLFVYFNRNNICDMKYFEFCHCFYFLCVLNICICSVSFAISDVYFTVLCIYGRLRHS